jgi:hypothetical protein
LAVTWKKLAYEDDVILKSVVTAKGDIIVGTGAGTVNELAIGADTYILYVNTDTPGWMDPATLAVGHHASTHHHDGDDVLTLDELGAPDAAVNFAGFQATDMVLETSASPPATPVVGKIYFDTDLSAYICTDSVA